MYEHSDAWLRRHLRVSRRTFNRIENVIRTRYVSMGYKIPSGNRLKVTFRASVAMTLFYLADQSGFKGVSDNFGFAKSGGITRINIILDVINDLFTDVIRLPETDAKW